jgi:8-amino-7-oxononanoate synthase
VTPDVLVGTLGKAFGAQGAFVGGRVLLREWLWNRARAFVFSTGLAPASAAAALRSLHAILEEPALPLQVLERAMELRDGLHRAGATLVTGRAPSPTPADEATQLLGFGHVVPVVLGSPSRALRWAERLRERGVEVMAIRPPTVPVGTARLRLTVTAQHRREDIERVVDAFASVARLEAAERERRP